jgi:ABC-type multidrug transport system fused ATPase/permease subunit
MIELLHANMVNSLTSAGLDAWYKLRIALASVFIVQIPCFAYMLFYHDDMSVSKMSLFMLIITGLSSDILQFLTFSGDFESSMIAIERINYFELIPHEAHYYNFEKERKKYFYIPAKVDLR